MSMVKAVIYALVKVSTYIILFMALAPVFYTMMQSFDTIVTDQGLSDLTSFWNYASPVLKTGFWVVAALCVIGVIIWVYMYAQRREYVTAGGVYVG